MHHRFCSTFSRRYTGASDRIGGTYINERSSVHRPPRGMAHSTSAQRAWGISRRRCCDLICQHQRQCRVDGGGH